MNLQRTLSSNQWVALRRISEGVWAPFVRLDLEGPSRFRGPLFLCRCGDVRQGPHHGFALYMTRAFRALIQRKLLLASEDGKVSLSPEAAKLFPPIPPKMEQRPFPMHRTRAARI